MANTEKIVVQVVVKGEKDLQRVGKSADKSTKSFGKMAAGVLGAVAAFKTISSAIGSAIKTFKAFEFQMAKVKAITGASSKDFLKLSKTAEDLGRSTFFTATQVAELQTNYGKLGFTTQEILNAQEATLNLATATGSDLARAATVAGASVRGFGLDASETERVVDVMAVAFTSSAMDIEKWQTSMTKVAPIAKSAGFSIEDTAAMMSKLTDSGIEASIAGTSLRNILLKMQDPNSDLTKSFGKTIHSFDELVPAMQKFVTEGGSMADIMEVVDDRQAAAFEQLISTSGATLQLRDSLLDASGAAQIMSDIVGDNLEGATRRFTSAWEGLMINFTESIIGKGLQSFVDKAASLVNVVSDFVDIPVSEKLEEQRLEMNLLGGAIQRVWENEEQRIGYIKELQTKYPKYFKDLDSEKVAWEDIEKAMKGANDEFLKTIEQQVMREEITAMTKEIREQKNALKDSTLETVKYLTGAAPLFNDVTLRNTTATSTFRDVVNDLKEQLQDGTISAEDYATANNVIAQSLLPAMKATKSLTDLEEKRTKVLKELEDIGGGDGGSKGGNGGNGGGNGGGGGDDTDAIVENTKAKKDNKQATELQAEADRDYFHIMNLVLDGTMTQKEAEEALRLERMMAIQDALDAMPLIYSDLEYRTKLEKELIDLKLKGLSDEKTARQEQIDGVAQLGDQLINLAGEDEKMQGIKKAGIALSSAAAIANNIQALSEMTLGVTSQAKLPFPANIIGMVTTLSTVVSLLANIKAMKGAFGDGGIIETFANGGMVNGKSHAQGGEKFAVGGRVVELEGGEAVINKRSTAMFGRQLSAMNAAGGGVKFADGGLLNQPSFSQQQFNALGQNQMMGAMGSSSKVVVVEADITDSQNSVSVIQSEATI